MHIVLYVLDSLRPDHLGCYGYERNTSPHIDALAQEGVVFENCFTSSTWTRPVAASILTGTYPGVHLTRSRYDMFSTNLTRLPEALRAVGYKTAAFTTLGNIASEIGFDRGFDHYWDLFREPSVLEKRRKLNPVVEGLTNTLDDEIALPRAEDVNEYFLPWITEQSRQNTFCFIWSVETHLPYTVPEMFRRFSATSTSFPFEGEINDVLSAGESDRQRIMNLYDDVVRYNDHCIGQVVSHLKTLGIFDNTLIIIAGDHGDAFYEHGLYGHGHAPYEELIHVPMVMKFMKGKYAGQRVRALTELIDIFPTVISASGNHSSTAGSDFVQGKDLSQLLEGVSSAVREHSFSDTQRLEVQNWSVSVRGKRWKYIQWQRPSRNWHTFAALLRHVVKTRTILRIIRNPRYYLRSQFSGTDEYLFDLEADPEEKVNLTNRHPEIASLLKQVLSDNQSKNVELAEQIGHKPYSFSESESLRQHLEDLGYL